MLRVHPKRVVTLCVAGLWWMGVHQALATEPAPQTPSDDVVREEPWLEPIPLPFDQELEQQIEEIQNALGAIHRQMVRRKEALDKTQDDAKKAAFYADLETLRKEREDLEALLHDLVDEARA